MRMKTDYEWAQGRIEDVTGLSKKQRETNACARRLEQMRKKREKQEKREEQVEELKS